MGQVAERHDEPAPKPLKTIDPAALIQYVMEKGGAPEQLEKFMALKERWDATEARKSFNAAFAGFKSEAVTILKGTAIKDGPLKGKFHANLHDVVVGSTAALAKHGLSASWKLTKDDPTWMEVTCTLRHVGGHSESVSMAGAPDTGPGRNAIQARGSTKTYLERYTLMGILGLAATEQDNDGGGGHLDPIDDKQALLINDLLVSTKSDKAKFLRYFKVKAIEELPKQAYGDAIAMLKAKVKQ